MQARLSWISYTAVFWDPYIGPAVYTYGHLHAPIQQLLLTCKCQHNKASASRPDRRFPQMRVHGAIRLPEADSRKRAGSLGVVVRIRRSSSCRQGDQAWVRSPRSQRFSTNFIAVYNLYAGKNNTFFGNVDELRNSYGTLRKFYTCKNETYSHKHLYLRLKSL
jgi:hypothetical protein